LWDLGFLENPSPRAGYLTSLGTESLISHTKAKRERKRQTPPADFFRLPRILLTHWKSFPLHPQIRHLGKEPESEQSEAVNQSLAFSKDALK